MQWEPCCACWRRIEKRSLGRQQDEETGADSAIYHWSAKSGRSLGSFWFLIVQRACVGAWGWRVAHFLACVTEPRMEMTCHFFQTQHATLGHCKRSASCSLFHFTCSIHAVIIIGGPSIWRVCVRSNEQVLACVTHCSPLVASRTGSSPLIRIRTRTTTWSHGQETHKPVAVRPMMSSQCLKPGAS